MLAIEDRELANTSYLVDLGDGSALAVDPARNPKPYLEAAKRSKLRIRYVAETHLHADFVSGGRELAALGAVQIAARRSRLPFPHLGVEDGDELVIGDLSLRVIGTPGHGPEHVSYLLCGAREQALFSGGALLPGGVARPDLVSPALTRRLGHLAFRSARRLLETVPAEVELRPTHGAGSFCATDQEGEGSGSTLGAVRASHPVLATDNPDVFVDELLTGLGTYPTYFRRLRELNRRGPRVLGSDHNQLPVLGRGQLRNHPVVDVRPIDRFAQGHIPGSISIALRAGFATWLGWLVPPAPAPVFVVDADQDESFLVSQAQKVGFDRIGGRVDLAGWSDDDLATIEILSARDLSPDARVIDVRQRSEWLQGHVPGALHLELGQLADKPVKVGEHVVIHCARGLRAMTAASLLVQAGAAKLAVTTDDYTAINREVGSQRAFRGRIDAGLGHKVDHELSQAQCSTSTSGIG